MTETLLRIAQTDLPDADATLALLERMPANEQDPVLLAALSSVRNRLISIQTELETLTE